MTTTLILKTGSKSSYIRYWQKELFQTVYIIQICFYITTDPPLHQFYRPQNMQQQDVDLIVVSLKSRNPYTEGMNRKIHTPIISISRLYNYGIPTNICATGVSEREITGCNIDYLSRIHQKSDVIRDTFVSMAVKSGWTTVVIFYDNKTVNMLNMVYMLKIYRSCSETSFVDNLLKPLSDFGISDFLKYNFDTLSSVTDIDNILNQLYHRLNDDGLNVTLLCEITCIKAVIQRVHVTHANMYDSSKVNKRKTAMHQNSKWLILAVFNEDMKQIPWHSFDLDNVALLDFGCSSLTEDQNKFMKQHIFNLRSQMDELLCGNYKDTSATSVHVLKLKMESIMESLDNVINTYEKNIFFPLKSLLWYKHGRELTTVGKVDMKGKLFLQQSDIYPNIHYGFNTRKFIVTTLAWPPFVKKVKHNGTIIYSGFCIDLLKELATTLNFTYLTILLGVCYLPIRNVIIESHSTTRRKISMRYEITEPADQEWGRLRKNKTWTGMIGQLENESQIKHQTAISTALGYFIHIYVRKWRTK
ncbi:hypothetical protein KUTeg_011809 [Tegillarca granosa]|uniref:Ionotropic glutamate receptor L-glutamate and glycine-binding domain-containing protein n=1 Tax=Tegillarca granosa TaxID=220873 RepID=A0ABQ9EXZ4_TEGGR|nr:hypothetical protein KUTeg_011809 [Tegillarca granosa]